MKILSVVLGLLASGSFAAAPPPATFRFSGYDWTVQRFGPNCEDFSAGEDHVRLDARGRLHLRATSRGGRRSCAEAASLASFGYGTYVFDVEAPVARYDDNVVLGLFTYDNDTASAHREIDVEFSRWGDPKRPNGQYTVQPHPDGGGECGKNDVQCRFEVPGDATRGVYVFRWEPGRVSFSARRADGRPLRSWVETKQVPSAGKVPVKLNLWFFGKPRAGDQEAECVIRRFTFVPDKD
ncbi:MAG TPA: glycoside hydrolase family 16 protein [Elusimicrobiota bacterium]|nr:glycoside hydrolase family 16 protein [Elusimicrobiota bacterium]